MGQCPQPAVGTTGIGIRNRPPPGRLRTRDCRREGCRSRPCGSAGHRGAKPCRSRRSTGKRGSGGSGRQIGFVRQRRHEHPRADRRTGGIHHRRSRQCGGLRLKSGQPARSGRCLHEHLPAYRQHQPSESERRSAYQTRRHRCGFPGKNQIHRHRSAIHAQSGGNHRRTRQADV